MAKLLRVATQRLSPWRGYCSRGSQVYVYVWMGSLEGGEPGVNFSGFCDVILQYDQLTFFCYRAGLWLLLSFL